MNNFLENTQLISGFHTTSIKLDPKFGYWGISRNKDQFRCPKCNSSHVRTACNGQREVNGLHMGTSSIIFVVRRHRIHCHDCKSYLTEKFDFLPSQKCTYTSAVAERVLNFRQEMTIQATAFFLNLRWDMVKEIEQQYLAKKYASVDLKNVRYIGIDELFLGKKIDYVTIVRDLETGRVLNVSKGKTGDSLTEFQQQLIDANAKIEVVAIDMGNAYACWAKTNWPEATITYDHFHVIKSMNEKLNELRRKTMAALLVEERQMLKGKRFHLIRNYENLSVNEQKDLEILRKTHADLGDASVMKECLRNIYKIAKTEEEARIAFEYWCKLAKESGVKELKSMAKTITQRLAGIISVWKTGVNSASMEGFNNKVGALQRQAYGYRDYEYLRLKIFDLPAICRRKKMA